MGLLIDMKKGCNWNHPVFLQIYTEADGLSFLTELYVRKPRKINFAHVLAKGQNQYPKFIYYKRNIILLTEEEHFLLDHGSEEQREKYRADCQAQGFDCDWDKLWELKKELIEEYNNL